MPIDPISAAKAVQATRPTQATQATPPAQTVGGVGGEGDFGSTMGRALDQLVGVNANADQLARTAASGNLEDASALMIAATQASVATELTVAVRNRAVEAFTSIMQMGV